MNGKGTKWGSDVALTFGYLTLSASYEAIETSRSGSDISVNVRPNVQLYEEMLGNANSWVGQRMEFVENQLEMVKRDIAKDADSFLFISFKFF